MLFDGGVKHCQSLLPMGFRTNLAILSVLHLHHPGLISCGRPHVGATWYQKYQMVVISAHTHHSARNQRP